MENSIKLDDLEVPLFLETPLYTNLGGFRGRYEFQSTPSRRPLQRLRLMAAVEVNFDDASCIDFMAFWNTILRPNKKKFKRLTCNKPFRNQHVVPGMFSLYKKNIPVFLNIPWTRFFQVGIYSNNVGISKVRNDRVLDLYQVGGTLRLENFVHEKFGRLTIPFPNRIYYLLVGGGFNISYFHIYLGKISNLTRLKPPTNYDLLTYSTWYLWCFETLLMRQNAWVLLMYAWKTWVVDHLSCWLLLHVGFMLCRGSCDPSKGWHWKPRGKTILWDRSTSWYCSVDSYGIFLYLITLSLAKWLNGTSKLCFIIISYYFNFTIVTKDP